MSPETNTSTETRIASGQTVHVPLPASGTEIAVSSSPGGVLDLTFDPSAATVTRVDNSLVFEVDGGGTVTINDFFAVGDDSLPSLRLPDGIEVASNDFFEGSDLDLSTAAGPAASAPPSSGTSYADDAGNLLNGVDRFGMLGTDYWGRATEPDIEARGTSNILGASGSFDFGVNTDLSAMGFGILGGVYEDGQPFQHQGDYSLHPAQIMFNPVPGPGTSVGEVRLSNFPEGSKIWLGDPNNGGTLLEPGPDGVYRFNPDMFNNPGVYFIPPENSDSDFDVNVSVDFHANGGSITLDGTMHVVVDAVADQPQDLGADPALGFDANGDPYTQAAPDSEITIKVSVTFGDFADGSEQHYLLVELLDGWQNSGGYELVDMDGKTYLKVPVNNADINPDGTITVDVKVTTPDIQADDDYSLKVWAVAEEQPSDSELNLDNNISMVETDVTVSIDVITGKVVLNTELLRNLYEDGQPYQYTDKDGKPIVMEGVDANREYQDGFDPNLGVQVFVPDADGNYLQGGSDSEYVSSITFSNVPDPAQGTLFYNGVPITEGMVIDNPDLSLITFKPGENWSGDLSFNYQVDVSSSTSGQTVSNDSETAEVHVDSVADLADAEINGLVQDTNGAEQFVVEADDGAARVEDGEKTGWYDSYADNETAVTATLSISFTLHDLDGSETAMILVPVTDGVVLLEDIDGNAPQIWTDADGNQFWIYAQGDAGDLQQELDNNGGSFDLKVSVSPDVQGGTLHVYVRTEEDSSGHKNNQDDNDAAMREVGEGINLSWLQNSVTVSTGWAYEGNDGSKHTADGNYNPDLGAIDDGSRGVTLNDGTYMQGAPVELDFGNFSHWVTQVTFTYDPSQGALYFNGTYIQPTDGTVTIVPAPGQSIDDALSNIVFVPSDKYSDDDINLGYTVSIDDGSNQFLVEGSTTIVVDAVADRAEVEDTSSRTDDNETVIITVDAVFKDTDGSEKHYILIEVKDGWGCPDANGNTTTIYYDAQGNVINPVWNPDSGQWEAPTGYADSKEFWQIDVTGQTKDGDTSFEVTLTPPAGAEDTNFGTGTMVVETPKDEEYDYDNNIAIDLKDGGTDVNVIDATIGGKATGAYEDGDANQHGAVKGDKNYVDDLVNDGTITITIGNHENGFENSGEYLDATPGGFVTLTFEWDGDPSATGYFTIVGSDGLTHYPVVPGDTPGTYKVEIPASDFGPGKLDEIQVQYHPPTNDDTDLKGINVSVPVTNDDGFTAELEGSIGDMVVDAVADKPTDVGTAITDIDGGYDKADWGSTVKITVEAKFYDFEDGSERHYLVIEARDGWTCEGADGVIEIDGTLYFYKEVDNAVLQNSEGKASFDFEMTAPAADSGAGDVGAIGSDGSVTFQTGGAAIEGGIKPDPDNPDVMIPDTKGSDSGELTTDNNVALTLDQDGAKVEFNTLDGSKGSGSAYEDHQPGQNTGNTSVDQTSGWITISLTDAANETINSGSLTFSFKDGMGGKPGTFTYLDADGNEVTLELGSANYIDNGDGTYTVILPDDVCGGGDVQIRYNPPVNDSTDLTGFKYELQVSANDSKAEGTITGSVNSKDDKGTEHQGTFIVDAVADMPVDPNTGDVVYNNNDDLSAAAPGGEVTIPISVGFGDYLDGSESHYIIIEKKAGWTPEPADRYTEVTQGGKTYYALDVTGIIAEALDGFDVAAFWAQNPGGGQHEVTIDGVTVTITVNSDGTLADSIEVSTDVTLNVPTDAYDKTTTESFEAGGLAVENGYSDNELDLGNNTAINTDKAEVIVDPVESKPTITMENDHIYENLKPNEHGAQQGDPKYVDAEADQPATMKFAGLAKDANGNTTETAEVTLFFSAFNPDGSPVDFEGGKVMVRDANGDYLADENGDPIEFDLEGPDANGSFYTVPALVLDGDATIEFYPGENYSDRDIKVDYDITVTDNSSGAQHSWTTQEKPTDGSADPNTTYDQDQGGISVDAVAQAPDVVASGGYGDDGQGNEYSAFPDGTSTITIDTQLTFGDWQDGSEFHYLLVEAQPGFEITEITLYDADGNVLGTFQLADGDQWRFDGTAYLRFEIPDDILQQCGGNLSAVISMSTPDGVSGTHTFKVGGMSQEDPNGLDDESTRLNNQAVEVKDTEVKFQGIGDIGVRTKDSGVYEGDAPSANVGDYSAHGGTEIEIILPGSPNVVSDINLSCEHGTIYVFPNNMSENDIKALLEAGGEALKEYEASGTYSVDDVNGNKFIYIADGTNDADDNVIVTGTVTNPNTGETHTSTDNAEVIVDAVAQAPDEVDGSGEDGSYSISVTFPDMDGSEEHFVLIEAKPGGSLDVNGINGPFEMYYHVDPETGEMTAYWKVPVGDDQYNENTGAYEIDFSYDGSGEFKYGSMGEETDLSGGELTFHNNTAITEDGKMGENAGGGGHELPDDKYIPPGDGHKCPHPESDVTNSGAYENGTPNANIGDNSVGSGDAILTFRYWNWTHHKDRPDPEGEEPGGSWCSPDYETPTEISVTFNPEDCAFLYNGQYIVEDGTDGTVSWKVTDNGDGTYTVTITDYDGGTVALRPGDYGSAYDDPSTFDDQNLDQYFNNSDADFNYGWSMTGPGSQYPHPDHPGYNPDGTYTDSGSGTVIVDAVAQGAEDAKYDDDGHIYGAVDGNDTQKVQLEAKLIDTDGSEQCFFLIEAVPGISVAGAETIYIDGTMYYKVPGTVGPDGVTVTADVDITVNRDALESSTAGSQKNADGSDTYELKYGTMTEEDIDRFSDANGELTYGNNMSFNADQTMEITVSYVDTEIKLTVEDAYENNAEAGGAISITIDLDDNDHLDEFSITFNPQAGEIVYLDDNGNQVDFDTVFGAGNWEIIKTSDSSWTLVITNPDPSDLASGLTFSTEGNYSSKDTSITWNAKVTDSASGDTETFGGTEQIIIDAVAQAPDVTGVELTNDNGGTAATSGGSATINMTLSFEDVGTGEKHYAVMANDGQWTCDEVVIILPDGTEHSVTPTLMYDQNGNPYYAVEIQDGWLSNGSVDVQFKVTAPKATTDTTYDIKVGGVSVEDYNQPDGELKLDNNWAENIITEQISVGVVEATDVTLTMGDTKEDVPTPMIFTVVGGTSESLSEVVITGMPEGGKIIGPDGTVYEYRGGQFWNGDTSLGTTLTLNGQDAEDGKYSFLPPEHKDGPFDITFEAKVRDNNSGDEKSFIPGQDDFTGTGSVNVEGVADAPENLNVGDVDYDSSTPGVHPDDPTAAKPGGTVTIEVSATFPDHDGSENHFVLVEYKPGWTCGGQAGTVVVGGVTYWKVPVKGPYGDNGEISQDIRLTPPSNLTGDDSYEFKVGGMSQEKSNNSTETVISNDSITVNVGVADSTASDVTITMGEVAEDGLKSDGAQITVNFDGLGANNDEIASFSITDLRGGRIWDSVAEEYVDGKNLDPAKLASGAYYYEPGPNQSGDISLGFSMTIRDANSGHQKTLPGNIEVKVTPVTDTPIDEKGSAGDASQQAGHTATVAISLEANFQDYTGTETHFFVVQLPAGATILGTEGTDWVLITDAADPRLGGMPVPAYLVMADKDGNASFNISVGENFPDTDITYKAGSYEKDLPDSDPDKYKFSEQGEVPVGGTGELNYNPTVNDGSARVDDALRDPDAGASGKVSMDDADGDEVRVNEVTYTDADGNVSTATTVTEGGVEYLVIEGAYGTLKINAGTGEYTYTLFKDSEGNFIAPPHGSEDTFNVTVTDDRGATDGANITVTIDAANADPTAVDPNFKAGGVDESELKSITGQVELQDADGDQVTITGITNGENAAMWSEADQTWTIQGQYGTLVITLGDDNKYTYEYTLAEHNVTGEKDVFNLSFSDPYGGTGESSFTVNVDYVNHAPVIENQEGYFNAGSGTFAYGTIGFSDADVTTQGDRVSITYVKYGNEIYEVKPGASTLIEIEGLGTFSIRADGSWVFNPVDGNTATANVWERFTIGVTDSHGTTTEGEFSLGLGNPSGDPHADSLVGPAAAMLSAPLGGEEAAQASLAVTRVDGARDGDIAFRMSLQNALGDAAVIAAEALSISFLLQVTPAAAIDWTGIEHTPYPGGGWLVSVELPAGSSAADVVIPVLGDAEGRSVTISGVEVSSGLDQSVQVETAGEFSFSYEAAGVADLGSDTLEAAGAQQALAGESAYDDVMYGETVSDDVIAVEADGQLPSGDEIFTWNDGTGIGGSDTIMDFDFNYQWDQGSLIAVEGQFNDQIQLNFSDLLGEDASLDDLLRNMTSGDNNSFSYKTDKGAFEAVFLEQDTLQITLTAGDDTLQTITVNANNPFYDVAQGLEAHHAAEILQQILRDC